MPSISTSRGRAGGPSRGFTLVELLVGLALSVVVALAVAPLWVSLQAAGARAADRTVWLLQGRVAVARFERDLRLAGGQGCLFALVGPVLEASSSQVVLLERPAPGSKPILVEWEIVKGSLMRRWGQCPATRPLVFRHSLYVDSKTMLEDVGAGSTFSYAVGGQVLPAPLAEPDLDLVEAVSLQLRSAGPGAAGCAVATTARVGR